jgi:hypothetical protein
VPTFPTVAPLEATPHQREFAIYVPSAPISNLVPGATLQFFERGTSKVATVDILD